MQSSTAAEPLVGTWKVNLEKSNYGALPAPKTDIAIFTPEEGGVFQFTAFAVGAQGEAIHSEFRTRLEGEECPVAGSPFMDTVIAKRIDARTSEWTAKKQGKVVVTAIEKVSADGRTLTGSWSRVDDQGRTLSWTTVSDRQ